GTPASQDAGESVGPADAPARWRAVATRVATWVRTRPVTAASAAIAGLVWLPPILAELGGGPSNVSNLVRATLQGDGQRPLGIGYAINTTARVLGGPPPFGPRPNVRAIWVVPLGVDLTSAAWVAAIAIGCGAAIVVGRRRRDTALTAIGSSMLGAMAMGLYLLERSTFSSGAAIYQTRWLWVLVAAAWLGLGLVAARLLGPVAHRLRPPRRWLATGLGVAVIGGAAIARLGFAGGPTERIGPSLANEQRSTREVVTGIEHHWKRGQGLAIAMPPFAVTPSVGPSLDVAANLELDGYQVTLVSSSRRQRRLLGPSHDGGPTAPAGRPVLTLYNGPRPAGAPGALVAQVAPLDAVERHEAQQLRARLRRDISRSTLVWTRYGGTLHFGVAPDAKTLLVHNTLAFAQYDGQISGRLPPLSLIKRESELVRRSDPDTQWTVLRTN
ncbi:MAG TPA: hypothetical protein VGM93_09370, partial [Acidimicrobiales bacterium]